MLQLAQLCSNLFCCCYRYAACYFIVNIPLNVISGPPNCTVDFSVMASGVTISVNLTVYACVGYLPGYEVVLSTIGNERSTISIETPAFMASSIIRISDLKAFSEYNVSLELVDPYCQNATVATKLVVTDMPPPGKCCRVFENMYFISLLAVMCLLYIALMSY